MSNAVNQNSLYSAVLHSIEKNIESITDRATDDAIEGCPHAF